MSPSKRRSKRPRVAKAKEEEENKPKPVKGDGAPQEDNDEAELMLQLMMQGGGESNNDDDDKIRKRREEQRKQRLKRVEKEQGNNTSAAMRIEKSNDDARQEEEPHQDVSVIETAAPDTEDNTHNDDAEDDFDMFSSSVSPVETAAKKTAPERLDARRKDDFQDEEGYYKAVIGEQLQVANHKFKVLGVVGKGVFSTVLKCSTTTTTTPPPSAITIPEIVALKCIRNNETMAKAAQNEIRFLQKLSHPNIVKLLLPTTNHMIEHRGHVVLVFPFQAYNLRDVLQKFGKGVGLSLTAVGAYFGQLLSALRALEKARLMHADLKPDNILVSADFSTCQLCDFGSCLEMGSADAVPTPYLVSRFYRAPEIILGGVPTPAIDLWSAAVTVAELFLGKVLFNGASNSDMLLVFMERLGPFSNKTLRQHQVAIQKYPGIPSHFSLKQQHYQFLQQTVDKATGKPVIKQVSLQQFPTKTLQSLLLKAKSVKDSRQDVLKFSDLLTKCLNLEPSRRISIVDAVKHDFFKAMRAANNNNA